MYFDGNFRELGKINNLPELQLAVSSESFRQKSLRDTAVNSPHADTRCVVGLFDIHNTLKGVMDERVFNKFYPLIEPAIKQFEEYYGYSFSILKSMILINLLSGGRIAPHGDKETYEGQDNDGIYDKCHRVHIVVTTNDKVLFNIGNEYKHLPEASIIEVNNIKEHFVLNNGFTDRIHIVIDLIGIKDRYSKDYDKIPENFYIKD